MNTPTLIAVRSHLTRMKWEIFSVLIPKVAHTTVITTNTRVFISKYNPRSDKHCEKIFLLLLIILLTISLYSCSFDANENLYEIVYAKNSLELDAQKQEFESERKEYLEDGAPDPSGVYNRKNFNVYGDISYPRPYNIMALGYDPNTTFKLNENIVSKDFIEYFNSYCDRMRAKGVTVYFSFCPINDKSLAEDTDASELARFEQYLKIEEEVIIPATYEDYPVIMISENVLSGFKNLKRVTLGENIRSLPDSVFADCNKLTEIHVKFGTNCLVSIPGEATEKGLMDGTIDGCLIYCEEKYRNDFLNHYTWQHYYKYFAK